ncbi:MAG: TonB-dependent receptor [Beijerinckiaceae bacterium]|nr:TonB-dependent receptor [Beijerinckiaceae bacterium]
MNALSRFMPLLRPIVMAACAATSTQALAQLQDAPQSNEIVVTPLRTPQAVAKTGSSVTVITREEIENKAAKSIADVLRPVEGLFVSERGGIGGNTSITVRGSKPSQTLVMIDGVRVGDPSSIAGDFDFGGYSPSDVERIEILRGPQSALYGSDAMGGVINIVTRKGAGTPKASLTAEAGSYGTMLGRASVTGSSNDFNYAFALNGLRSNGFSSFGYRIGRYAAYGPFESDPVQKLNGSARLGWDGGQGVSIEAGYLGFWANTHYDNAISANATASDIAFTDVGLNKQRGFTNQAWVKGAVVGLDGRMTTTLNIFGNRTDRYTTYDWSSSWGPYTGINDYRGERYGAELQNNFKINEQFLLITGLRNESETAKIVSGGIPRNTTPLNVDVNASQMTNSAFSTLQWTPTEKWAFSFGGRVDDVEGIDNFWTWRGTAAYDLTSTTKLRASAGTGAKAPSLYQMYSAYGPIANNLPALQPEHNIGVDAGIDQSLFAGRLVLSGTAFWSRYRNLIDFACAGFTCVYYNVGRAAISGLEASAKYNLVPGEWLLKGTYTYTYAENLDTDTQLLRRPRNRGSISAVYTGITNTEIEAQLYLVGSQLEYGDIKLAPYARLDMWARYKFTDQFSVYLRGENLTNAHYQEAYGYGTAGRSVYAGVKATW